MQGTPNWGHLGSPGGEWQNAPEACVYYTPPRVPMCGSKLIDFAGFCVFLCLQLLNINEIAQQYTQLIVALAQNTTPWWLKWNG